MTGVDPAAPAQGSVAIATRRPGGMRLEDLFAVEWSRFFRRRLTMVMLVLMVVTSALAALGLAANSERPTDLQRAEAREQVAVAIERREELARQCQDRAIPEENCHLGQVPTEDDFLPYAFSFVREASGMLYLACLMLCVFGFLVGASFVGAEWTSGGMMNLLLWHPRRATVLAVKLATALAAVAAVSLAYLVVWLGTGVGIGAAIGTVGSFDPGVPGSLGLLTLRILTLVLAVTATGFALASLGRHTAAAPGIAVGYAVLVEVGLFIVLNVLRLDDIDQYRLSAHLATWLTGEDPFHTVSCYDACVDASPFGFDWIRSALVLGLGVGALVTAAFAAIRRRDVT